MARPRLWRPRLHSKTIDDSSPVTNAGGRLPTHGWGRGCWRGSDEERGTAIPQRLRISNCGGKLDLVDMNLVYSTYLITISVKKILGTEKELRIILSLNFSSARKANKSIVGHILSG